MPPNPGYIDSVLAKGVTLLNRSGWFNAIDIYVTDTNKMASIRALPFVKNCFVASCIGPKHNSGNYNKLFAGERNNFYRPQSADTLDYNYSYNQVHMIKVDCLNNMGYRGKGKQIAVIDVHFGVAYSLPAFDSIRDRGQILGMWDFVGEKPSVYDSTNSDNHGQMVLSCMAGNLPGQFLGDALDADYYLFRTDENVPASAPDSLIEVENWAAAAEYADSAGADIITTSLGYTEMYPANYTYADMNGKTEIASIAATIAAEKGMVVCAAAGNDGDDSWHYICSPADADSILTVGAVNSSGGYAYFSSTGPTADGRIKPDVAAQGDPTAVANPSGGVLEGAGTSFATPLIAGGVASLWQADSNAGNMQIINAVKQSASLYATPDSLLGYGIPDFCLAYNILMGISENKPVSQLVKTYPNPFTNAITLEFYSSYNQNNKISLYNSIGQIVCRQTERTVSGGNIIINLSNLQNLPQGIYLVTLSDGQGMTYTQKLVK